VRAEYSPPAPFFDDGRVSIYCADAFEVLHHLADVDAVVTDPPYSSGGAFRGDRAQQTTTKYVQTSTLAYRPDFAGDNRDQRSFLAWSTLWMSAARWACRPGALLAVFTDWRQLPITTDAVQAAGWVWRGVAVWSKKYGRPNPAGFSSAAEFVVWATNGPADEAETKPAGVFECHPPPDRVHIAQKPEEVMRWLVSATAPGGTVLDPFMGSGTTLRAALDLGRRAIGIDVDPRYCSHASDRLAQGVLDLDA
jgi:site-specific DNA-methyltransferase (adenine-specific)